MHGHKNLGGQEEMGNSNINTFYLNIMTYNMLGYGLEIWQGNIAQAILMIQHINLVLPSHFLKHILQGFAGEIAT